MKLKVFLWTVLLPSVAWLTAGCSAIDEDLSNCGNDYQLDYELKLVTNMSIEMETQLSIVTDAGIAEVLRNHLKNIFTDYAHDVDLSFYDTENNQPRLQHDQHIMDANQQSYRIGQQVSASIM